MCTRRGETKKAEGGKLQSTEPCLPCCCPDRFRLTAASVLEAERCSCVVCHHTEVTTLSCRVEGGRETGAGKRGHLAGRAVKNTHDLPPLKPRSPPVISGVIQEPSVACSGEYVSYRGPICWRFGMGAPTKVAFLSLDFVVVHHAFPSSETLGVGLAGGVEAEIVFDRGESRRGLRIGPDAAGDKGALVLAELEVVVGCHAFPFAHGTSRLGRLDEVHLDAARWEVVRGRVRGFEDAVALRGFGDDELLLGRCDPDDPQPS